MLFPLLAIDSLVCTGDLICVYSCDSNYSFPLRVKCISYHYTLYCNLRGYANYFPYQTTTNVIASIASPFFFFHAPSLSSPSLSSKISSRLSFHTSFHFSSTVPPVRETSSPFVLASYLTIRSYRDENHRSWRFILIERFIL